MYHPAPHHPHPHHPLLRQPQPHDDARHRQHKDGGGGGDGFDDGHYHQLLALNLAAIQFLNCVQYVANLNEKSR